MRSDWNEYFLNMVPLVAERATCTRAKVGCILVSEDNRILMTGYNGSPAGLPHCLDVGCSVERTRDEAGKVHEHCNRTIHAEMNAILYCARNGIELKGATAYISTVPCFRCAMALVSCDIRTVWALGDYHRADKTWELFRQCGINMFIAQ